MKRWYLYPFAVAYHAVTAFRNTLYDSGIIRSATFKIPIINVGNLSTGGSGKSPMVMYLAELLSKRYRTGVLSRGYGRVTKGYGVVNYGSTYKTVGDEAMQLFERFKNKFVIAVSEKRVPAAKKLIKEMDLQVLILDDAYQHRAIKAGFNLLLSDYSHPYFSDFLLPAGNLRESRNSASRADLIVITKCPDELSEEKKQLYISKINPKSASDVFFSSIIYDEYIFGNGKSIPDNNLAYYEILLITGIANPKPLVQRLERFSSNFTHLKYRDHHNFSEDDLRHISAEYRKLGDYKLILTTEKDYTRLKGFDFMKDKLYYWPIQTQLDRQEEFEKRIFGYVEKGVISL